MFTIVFNDFWPVGKLPNRRDLGSLSQIGPESFVNSLCLSKKNTFTHGAPGSQLYALLTVQIIFFKAKIAITRKRYREKIKSVDVLVSIFALNSSKNYDILILLIVFRNSVGVDQPTDQSGCLPISAATKAIQCFKNPAKISLSHLQNNSNMQGGHVITKPRNYVVITRFRNYS